GDARLRAGCGRIHEYADDHGPAGRVGEAAHDAEPRAGSVYLREADGARFLVARSAQPPDVVAEHGRCGVRLAVRDGRVGEHAQADLAEGAPVVRPEAAHREARHDAASCTAAAPTRAPRGSR